MNDPGAGPRAVAVVIPVWDGYVRWLEEAVDSVVSQNVAEQVIVVDNASLEPVPQHAGTTVVRAPRRLSTGAARNLGLEAVRTPYVIFLDADDMMLPDSLSWMVEGIASRPSAVALGMALIEADTGSRHRSPRPIAALLARRARVFALATSVWSLVPTQGTMIMRTETVRGTGGYGDRSQGEDWVLGASLAWRGSIAFDRRIALLYRWRPDSPGRPGARPPPLFENARRVRERIRKDPGLPAAARVALPVLAVLQWTAILALRPIFLSLRWLSARRPGTT